MLPHRVKASSWVIFDIEGFPFWIQSVDNTLCFEQSEAVADEAKTSDPVGELLLSALIEAHVIRFVRALPTLGVARLIARATCLRRTGPGRCTTSDLGGP